MNFLPVITRELQAQARQSFTYWLRALGLLLLLGGSVFFISDELFEANLGGRLFGSMHLLCYLAIWLFVPLSAADCISRERREGTLGLLFLTPLKPPHIVIAKSIAHGLRAWTLIVAVIPALTIPFLLGGVSWPQALFSAVANLNAVCWCLAAALVASSIAYTSNQALALAAGLAAVGFVVFAWAVGAGLGLHSQTTWTTGYSQWAYDFFVGFSVVGMPRLDFSYLLRYLKMSQLSFALGMASLVSLAVLSFAVIFAANRIRRSWRDQPRSARAEQLHRTFLQPRFGVGFLRRWMARKLERNPIGWLEQRRWSGRMVTWAWFAIIISLYSAVLTDQNFFRGGGVQSLIGWLLALSMAATAAGSFKRERESGVLELLLVSPLTTRQIIGGRLRGLWGQFAPAAVTFLVVWSYLIGLYSQYAYANWLGNRSGELQEVWFFAASFAVIPVIGLHFSLSCRHYITALLLTLGLTFVLPALAFIVIRFAWWLHLNSPAPFEWEEAVLRYLWLIQLLCAGGLLARLHRNLARRTFAVERSLA
jgi:ABC-type transport system involved in multi-copper enzyme maturation permease subunit